MASRSRFPDVSIPDDISLPEYVLKGVDRYQDNIAFVSMHQLSRVVSMGARS